MRTIGKHWYGPGGDFQSLCDYCGVQWRRSQLHRDGSGLLACPDEGRGLDTVTLSKGNAETASERRLGRYVRDGANWDFDKSPPAPPFVPANSPSVSPQFNVGPTGSLSAIVHSWLRADAVTLSAGRVSLWNDQSGRGTNFGLRFTGMPAIYSAVDASLDGNPTIGFDGTTMWLSTSLAHNFPLWVWFIMRQDSWVASTTVFSGAGGVIRNNASPIARLARSSQGSDNSGAPVGTWVRGVANFTVSGTDYLRLGGSTIVNAGAGQRNGTSITIGSGLVTGGASSAACSFAEMLFVAREPTAAEQSAIDAYGETRYPSARF